MMLIHEYRVVMPLTVDEYHIGSLYTIAQISKEETGGSEGVEIVKNEPFDNFPLLGGKYSSGQYTLKIYHLEKKMPALLRYLSPRGSKEVHEECWNAYPYTKTIITNPGYMKDDFRLEIITLHKNDRGNSDNVLELPPNILEKREVTKIDIANDPLPPSDCKPENDPKLYHSTKTDRGPLKGNWVETVSPVMTCYKLVNIHFKWFGLQGKVERVMHKFERRIFTILNRRIFCLLDDWYGMTISDIRRMEDELKTLLNQQRLNENFKGTADFSE